MFIMFFVLYFPFLIRSYNNQITKKSDEPAEELIIKYSNPSMYQFFLGPGRYKVICYGAQGGYSNSGNPGGKGALVSGYFNVNQYNQTFYAFVGGQGIQSVYGSASGGFNGGGVSGHCHRYKKHWHHHQKPFGPGSGGGATDLRIDTNEIQNRIIVAGGGSGAGHDNQGAPGGDLNGYNVYGPSQNTNQISGNSNGVGSSGGSARRYPASGGGGGYRGGSAGVTTNDYTPLVVSDSGSSYISGYPGCTAHSKIQFDSYEMKAGINSGHGSIEIFRVFGCSANCISCETPEHCRNCDPSFRLFEGLCYSDCPIGSIDRNSYCEKCDSSCKSCSEVSTNCTSCPEDKFHYKDRCLAKCPTGTYEFGVECYDVCPLGTFQNGEKCGECEIPCKECTGSPTKCTDCIEGKYLFNNQCMDKCPDRTVRDGNKCLSECQSDQFLYDGFCYSHCPKGTYAKGVECYNCDSSCAECRSDAKTCIKCNGNTFLHNSQCLSKCPEGFYSYDNKCVSDCPSETFLNGQECLDVCPNGKYGNNHICKDCDPICESCENSSTLCTKCPNNNYLFNNKCITECPDGTYIYQNECLLECPEKFYPIGNICEQGIAYYDEEETVKRKPKISKAVTGVVLSFLVIILVILVVLIICMYIRSKVNIFSKFT